MKFLREYWPTLMVVAVILYATLSEDPAGADEFPSIPHLDKIIHAVMFGGLVGAWAFDRYRSGHELTRRYMLGVAAACLVAGALDEIAQHFFTVGRAADPFDLIADATGIAVAFFAAPPAVRAVVNGARRRK